MGNVASRAEDSATGSLYLRDQTRFAISSINVVNSSNKILLTITPAEYPSRRYIARRESPDDPPVEYIQDPDVSAAQSPSFLLQLQHEDDLTIQFSFVLRQLLPSPPNASSATTPLETSIHGLTFMHAANTRDLDNLITRELHSDPNMHKNNPNVHLVGDYSTGAVQSVQYTWSWRWRPPRNLEERTRGWRNCCSFVEYDQRNHRLDPLATFQFWVASPRSPTLLKSISRLDPGNTGATVRLRVPSAQSVDSRVSDSDDGGPSYKEGPTTVPSIDPIPESHFDFEPSVSDAGTSATRVDVNCQRPGEDVTTVEDGPLFRATMKAMELKTGTMRARWKKVLKRAETAYDAQIVRNNAIEALTDALREAAGSTAQAVQPAMEHYFDKIAKEILNNDRKTTIQLQKLIIDPISKLYNNDIKQADAKKRDFDEESKEYYAFVSRYLGQRQDSLKEKKRNETDTKYQSRRTRFELKRFDYSSYLQDLHGGRKDQEVLSNLTKFADAQAKGYLETSKTIETLLPQLEALNSEVKDADTAFKMHRTEREEKRRALEKNASSSQDVEGASLSTMTSNGSQPVAQKTTEHSRSSSVLPGRSQSQSMPVTSKTLTPVATGQTAVQTIGLSSSPSNRFKGIRDLEEPNHSAIDEAGGSDVVRKEGLIWALSRPGTHIDPRGLSKQAWHKFWIVLDQGKISEYTNWKQKLDLHMDPIDLRVASVREARNADRRFCFEIITPSFTRIYQATSEEDMKSWIFTINNALQSAVEGKGAQGPVSMDASSSSIRKDFASALTGKSQSQRTGAMHGGNKIVGRHATVGDRPSNRAYVESNEASQKLLQRIRASDESNKLCADCGSESKVDWVSINLGVVICIECSGIHRSLGTHVSKVRSITLDPNAFTQDVTEIFLSLGNRVSNGIWEAELETSLKSAPQSSREQRLRFITSKYVDRAFVAPLAVGASHFATADDTLLASIKKNDIRTVVYALALRANPNVIDKSRSTHAVFLALAAADPAPPAGNMSPSIVSAGSPGHPAPVRVSFPVAELLLLNGAIMPTTAAPIPLSLSGRTYVDVKLSQLDGRRLVTTNNAPAQASHASPTLDSNATFASPTSRLTTRGNDLSPGVGTGGDTLTALPSIGSAGAEQSRRKRISSGGRLIKASPADRGPGAASPRDSGSPFSAQGINTNNNGNSNSGSGF